MTITAESAVEYVRALFGSKVYAEIYVSVETVTPNDLDGDPAFDVSFAYADMRGIVQKGCMTVWLQSDGTHYGEW